MAKYDVRVRYTFEGTYKVVAEDRDEAERIVTEDCGLVLGGNIHTTCDDDEVTDWRFGCHPDMQILSFRERGGKGKVRYTSMCFSDRIEELRKDIIEAIRELAPQVEMIMSGQSWREPFRNKQELADWCRDNQPYYKKRIPEVNSHFAKMYNLK